MREIVATIQAEQDHVIRAPIDQVLVVQGGPGTGKTAVALHRAAYLMFEHRRRLARDGVLVVGPNRAFLDYIANVLPSLGERSVRQCTAADLCVPKVDVTGDDDPSTAARKGSAAMLDELAAAALRVISPPAGDVVVPLGVRRLVFAGAEIAEWLERAADAVIPVNQRRQRLRAIAGQELQRRTGPRRRLVRRRPAETGAGQVVADSTAGSPGRPLPRRALRRTARTAQGVDCRRPVARRRGQLDPQRAAVDLRPCRRRRGPGPLRRRPADHRQTLAGAFDDAGRRCRPVDGPGRAGALGRRLRRHRRRGRRAHSPHCRAEHRLPRARAGPRRGQPAAAVHRRRRHTEPQRAQRRFAADGGRRPTRVGWPRPWPAWSPRSSIGTA